MSEKIEKFIRNNRIEFDSVEPPAGLWERIEHDIATVAKIKPLSQRVIPVGFILKAACMICLITIGFVCYTRYQQKQPVDISKISPEMGKLQVQYAALIEDKQHELQSIEKENPALYSEFAAEIKRMDLTYQKLRNDLSTSPNQTETVKAMIRNLQTQLDVLNQQLIIIEQINGIQEKEQKNDTQTI